MVNTVGWASAHQLHPGRHLNARAKERTSFLKKRSKKLLSVSAAAFPVRLSPNEQKFFGSFFQKRTASFA
jgi:hypothetical protein